MRLRPSALPWPRRPAARALAGAQAMGALRRSLARQAVHGLGLRRFADWLRALTAPAPSLAEDERLGILAVLVAQTAPHPADEDGPSARAAGGKPALPGRRPGRPGGAHDARRRRKRTAGGADAAGPARARALTDDPALESSARRPVPALPRSATRVRHPLPPLPRGASARSGAVSAASPEATARTRALAPAQSMRARRSRRPAPDPRSGTHDPTATLTDVLAARAGRRLSAAVDAAAAAATVRSPIAELATTLRTTDAGNPPPAHEIVRAALTRQWAEPVAGRCAPADLLRRLIDDPFTGAGSVPPARTDDPRAALRQPGAPDPPAERRRALPDTDLRLPAASSPAAAAPPPLHTAALGAPPEPLRALAADVPARGLGAPAEASARLRLPALQDTRPDEDLDVLAANVKRILDQEARRHGIDV